MIKSLLKKTKKSNVLGVTAAIITLSSSVFAQSGNTLQLGKANAFAQKFLTEQSTAERSSITIETTESTLPVFINVNNDKGIRGGIVGIADANLFLDIVDNKVEGKLIIPSQKKAFNYFTDAKGNVQVEQVDINSVVCVDMYNGPMEPSAERSGNVSMAIPELESSPGEIAVAYLDFDGQTVSGGKWKNGGTINAQPANMTESAMTNAFNVMAEDFRPYKINVTTKLSVYNAAPKNRRMRCIITPTDDAADGAGGVAYIGSFDAGDDNTPCWVFNLGGNGQTTGETCSHEVGHTVGLEHDGNSSTTYYTGHNMWAPIMGASYNKTVTQWSKGEYSGANEKQDDVNVIANQNGFTWKADEAGNTIATAAALKIESNGSSVLAANNYGIILKADDVDVYSFKTGAGSVTFTVNPAPNFPDLDVALKITDASGVEQVSANSTSTLSSTVTKTLTAGTYYLHIDGVGSGTASNGYTDYASVGEYRIEGKVVAVTTGITETDKTTASVYPNPATESINVVLGTASASNTIRIINVLGQTLQTVQTDQQSLTINLSTYNKGIYFLTVSNESGTNTIRFVKE